MTEKAVRARWPTRDELALSGTTLVLAVIVVLGLPVNERWPTVALISLSLVAALGLRRAPVPLPRAAPLAPAVALIGSLVVLPEVVLTLPLGLAAGVVLLLWVGLPDLAGLPMEWARVGLEIAMVSLAGALALALALDLSSTVSVGTWVDVPFLLILGVVVLVLLALSTRPVSPPASAA